MSDRFEDYTSVLNSLVSEAISCSPVSWDDGFLTIDCDGSYINYKLKNESSEDKAQISDELRRLCEELYVVMRAAGDIWLVATVHFFKKNEDWSFKVDFKYPENMQNDLQNIGAAQGKKPWWKVWH